MRDAGRKRPLTHAHARLLVSKTWDGEVTEEELHRLVAHLRGCPPCLADAEKMQEFLTKLDHCFRRRRARGSPRGTPGESA